MIRVFRKETGNPNVGYVKWFINNRPVTREGYEMAEKQWRQLNGMSDKGAKIKKMMAGFNNHA
jgi:hypothetical protein